METKKMEQMRTKHTGANTYECEYCSRIIAAHYRENPAAYIAEYHGAESVRLRQLRRHRAAMARKARSEAIRRAGDAA
jgi:hypothetical protein